MNKIKKYRSKYPKTNQKQKLIEFIANHPHMISCKVTEEYRTTDFQKLWRDLANELNSLPGPKRTWKQWRKTWQDLRVRLKKGYRPFGCKSSSFLKLVDKLSEDDKNSLGVKENNILDDNPPQSPKIVFDDNHFSEKEYFIYNDIGDSVGNTLENVDASASPKETKVFIESFETSNTLSPSPQIQTKSTCDNCALNCESLTAQGERKLKLKEEYLKLKSKYLKRKLILMEEHNEVLRSIAEALRRRP